MNKDIRLLLFHYLVLAKHLYLGKYDQYSHYICFVMIIIITIITRMSATGIVQYVIVRGDLIKELKWPIGALIAQACHAVTATTHLFYDDPHTQEYLKDLDNMHKVVLEAPNETSLIELKDKLIEANINHKLWIEQPENIPTCLVAKPYPKEEVQRYFKKFKLFKG